MPNKITTPDELLEAYGQIWDIYDQTGSIRAAREGRADNVVFTVGDDYKDALRASMPDLPDEFFLPDAKKLVNARYENAIAAGYSGKYDEYNQKTFINEHNFWVYRDVYRLNNSEWTVPPFLKMLWMDHIYVPATALHFPHISVEDPTMIAYTPSYDYAKRDRQVRVKVGKYLQQFYSHVLTAERIRDFANGQKGFELIISSDVDEMVRVYAEGPSSCMSGKPDSWDDELDDHHPVEVYEGEFSIAYIKCGKTILARALVHELTKSFVRCYGDEADTLDVMLRNKGYTHENAYEDASIKKIEIAPGKFLMPYIDGGARGVVDHPTKPNMWMIVCGSQHYKFYADSTSGYVMDYEAAGLTQCDCCDGHFDSDDMTYSEYHGANICNNCLDYYKYAYVRRGDQDWVHNYDAIRCESDDEYYCTRFLDEYNIVSTPDGYYFADDVVDTIEDEYVHVDNAVEIGEDSYGDTKYVRDNYCQSKLILEFGDAFRPIRVWLSDYMTEDADEACNKQETFIADNGVTLGKRFNTVGQLALVFDNKAITEMLNSCGIYPSSYLIKTVCDSIRESAALLQQAA